MVQVTGGGFGRFNSNSFQIPATPSPLASLPFVAICHQNDF
jgi:hypothetical protein